MLAPHAELSDEALLQRCDAAYRAVGAAERAFFAELAHIDRAELWRSADADAVDMAHWVVLRYGLSYWKAQRWVAAARALESLPLIAAAFARGELSLDRLVELTRLASASEKSEVALLAWAEDHGPGAIRERADREIRLAREEVTSIEEDRHLSWSYVDQGRRLELWARMSAADRALVLRGLRRVAQQLPVPSSREPDPQGARLLDALVGMASARIAVDPDADRATVVVHAGLEQMASGIATGEIEDAGVIDPPVLERLSCSARIQGVVEDADADAFALGRTRRTPSAAMVRQLRYRDRDCRFPNCGRRRFTDAHHVVHWARGGRTDLDNLVLLCSFHHKLVHEHGWALTREDEGTVRWFRPDGTRYRAGPAPPSRAA